MPNYRLKAQVISSGIVSEYKHIKRAIWADGWKRTTGEIFKNTMDIETAEERRFFYSHLMPEEWKEAERVYDANKHQVSRVKKRIVQMLTTSKHCVFLTLTFRDDVLASTTSETRRQYVRKFLKQYSNHYVANIDYGGKNGREHYHAVVDERIDPNSWVYGNLDVKKVRYNPESKSPVKLAKYVAKLTNHAIKETTKRCHLIYSRR